MSNPILSLLATKKLTGENFVKWKSNMNIALLYDNYKFVLTEECSSELATNASRTVRDAYDHWINANNKAQCYLLASTSGVLRAKHERMENAHEMTESLQQMFGRPSEQQQHEAVKAVMNGKMKRGVPVHEHVIKMVSHINEAKENGVVIDEATQVGMILETLSLDFL